MGTVWSNWSISTNTIVDNTQINICYRANIMGPITKQLYKQIKGWRIYSVIAPAVFCAISAFLYLHYGTTWQIIFFTGLIILGVTCISWWHWSLSTMVTMLAIMKDTDDHFEKVNEQLTQISKRIEPGTLRIVTNTVDNPK